MCADTYEAPVRTWSAESWQLDLWDTGRTDWYGKSVLRYRFTDCHRVIFEGDNFSPSPLHAIDSDATVAGLLCFLSLRPGDTDVEYFDSYSPSQLAWAEANGELLSCYVYDLEREAS